LFKTLIQIDPNT